MKIRLIAAILLAAVSVAALFAAACGGDSNTSDTATPRAMNNMAGMDHGGMPMGSMTPGAGGGMGNMSGMMDGSRMMDGDVPAGTVVVHLSNWIVSTSQSVVKAGEVHFRVVHMPMDMHSADGAGKYHQLDVVRKNADGSYEAIGRTGQLSYGEQQDLTLTLAPGEYVLQCSIVEVIDGKAVSHYVMGMHTQFTVE